MSVMGFQKKFVWGVGELGELYPSLFWIFGILLTLQSPLKYQHQGEGHRSTNHVPFSPHAVISEILTTATAVDLTISVGETVV